MSALLDEYRAAVADIAAAGVDLEDEAVWLGMLELATTHEEKLNFLRLHGLYRADKMAAVLKQEWNNHLARLEHDTRANQATATKVSPVQVSRGVQRDD